MKTRRGAVEGRRAAWMRAAMAAGVLGAAGGARAQFSPPAPSNYREIVFGSLTLGSGAATPEDGDQIAVLWQDEVIGVYTYFAGQEDPLAYEITVSGDDPDTLSVVEGPAFNDAVTYAFYDASTDSERTDIVAINASGETVTGRFRGEQSFTIPGLPFDFAPRREVLLRLGAGDGSSGGGDGDGGGSTPKGDPDVDGDGKITKEDAALVLRIVSGSARRVSAAAVARADVNNDGVVTAADAVAVLRARR